MQNPLNASYTEILYRTGDLVRRDAEDGKLYFVGRKDLQVKHQGYRIELEEIQHALVSLAGVDDAAILHHRDEDGSRLIAVVATATPLDPATLKNRVAGSLPHYMIPEAFHLVEKLPKNPNGKTDRRRLMVEFFGL